MEILESSLFWWVWRRSTQRDEVSNRTLLLQVVENPVQIGVSKKERYWLLSLKSSRVVFGFRHGFRVQMIDQDLFSYLPLSHAVLSRWLGEAAGSDPMDGGSCLSPSYPSNSPVTSHKLICSEGLGMCSLPGVDGVSHPWRHMSSEEEKDESSEETQGQLQSKGRRRNGSK